MLIQLDKSESKSVFVVTLLVFFGSEKCTYEELLAKVGHLRATMPVKDTKEGVLSFFIDTCILTLTI